MPDIPWILKQDDFKKYTREELTERQRAINSLPMGATSTACALALLTEDEIEQAVREGREEHGRREPGQLFPEYRKEKS